MSALQLRQNRAWDRVSSRRIALCDACEVHVQAACVTISVGKPQDILRRKQQGAITPMTPQQFTKKWQASTLKERSAAQEHFIDLCRLLSEQTPAEADPDGVWYCFERGAKKTGGGDGWADVWRRGYFAWEYKGKHKDLTTAFAQLQRYAIALENPPLLVVSDMDSILIHTNFTNTVQEVHSISLAELDAPGNVQKLKWLFTDPERFRPGQTTAAITEEAASKFAALAQVLRQRGYDPQQVAHFLNKLLFCFFAEDAGLLPPRLVVKLLEAGVKHPDQANGMLRSLFGAMTRGGLFGADLIEWFNGGLFDSDDAIPLEPADVKEMLSAARLDWSAIEPSIFGTLFERGLDPNKRSQLGAHYTDPQSIMRLVQPVVVEPLAAEWEKAKAGIAAALDKARTTTSASARTKATKDAEALYSGFLHRLAEFRVLDPACGSGNFLYLALQSLKDLEHRAMLEAEQFGLHLGFPGMNVGVQCVRGIELNTYAAELARVTVWIGEIQWMLRHGVPPSKNPILKPLETIECRDALVNEDGTEADWPRVNAIVGNPPFLGNKRMLTELGDDYTRALRCLFAGDLPGGVDLVVYWFEKARAQLASGKVDSVGLVATQAIRKGANRKVLDRIVENSPVFAAWSDEPWINEGAAVRVSLIGFGRGGPPRLNGMVVPGIQADLTPEISGLDLTRAAPLAENQGVAFQGTIKTGPMDIPGELARKWLLLPNPNGRPNSDVLRPWANGQDVTGRPSDTWIIDFGVSRSESEATMYEAPFQYLLQYVKAGRQEKRERRAADKWWLMQRPRPEMRAAMVKLKRYIATPRVAKHRFFVWLPVTVIPDSRLYAICMDDDFTFGVLSSRIHVVWALSNGSRHGDGSEGGRPTYNATDCFETFPFPQCNEQLRSPVGRAAARLAELRNLWLDPPEWTESVAEAVPGYPSRIIAKPGHEDDLKGRTMTDLYNSQPAWLDTAHRDLDVAVAAAYGWKDYTPIMQDEEILRRLLELNAARASAGAPITPPRPQ